MYPSQLPDHVLMVGLVGAAPYFQQLGVPPQPLHHIVAYIPGIYSVYGV